MADDAPAALPGPVSDDEDDLAVLDFGDLDIALGVLDQDLENLLRLSPGAPSALPDGQITQYDRRVVSIAPVLPPPSSAVAAPTPDPHAVEGVARILKDKAESAGFGEMTQPFKQGSENPWLGFRSLVGEMGLTPAEINACERGVCDAMCLTWMKFRAKTKDFWSWLRDSERINVGAARKIYRKQASWRAFDFNRLKKHFAEIGFTLDENNVESFNRPSGENAGGMGAKIALQMFKNRESERLWFIVLDSDQGNMAHAVSAHVISDTIVWMDPNYGEFQFENHNAFSFWLNLIFFPQTGYDQRFTSYRLEPATRSPQL